MGYGGEEEAEKEEPEGVEEADHDDITRVVMILVKIWPLRHLCLRPRICIYDEVVSWVDKLHLLTWRAPAAFLVVANVGSYLFRDRQGI